MGIITLDSRRMGYCHRRTHFRDGSVQFRYGSGTIHVQFDRTDLLCPTSYKPPPRKGSVRVLKVITLSLLW